MIMIVPKQDLARVVLHGMMQTRQYSGSMIWRNTMALSSTIATCTTPTVSLGALKRFCSFALVFLLCACPLTRQQYYTVTVICVRHFASQGAIDGVIVYDPSHSGGLSTNAALIRCAASGEKNFIAVGTPAMLTFLTETLKVPIVANVSLSNPLTGECLRDQRIGNSS